MSDTWNPDLYLQYQNERTQPSYDLVARIQLAQPRQIVDIGCGPGNSTRVLKQRWPAARILGLDNSPEMLAQARRQDPDSEWLLADAADWQPETPYDLVFSNATLQWLPDHAALIPALFSRVQAGGALAVQVPSNHISPLYQAMLQVAESPAWRQQLAGHAPAPLYHSAEFYYALLAPLSQKLFIWYTTYYHVLDSRQGLVDWYASTAMKPYLERLPGDDAKRRFQSDILDACRADYPVQPDGKLLFPFRRLFFIAYHDAT